ncbi:hypothetical protein [Micromonospora sp. DT231]|uniref:hypothetical protein n=1 Tax=Micromonospora sp. DT231 TaxID=3416526 RepID=UPI003CEE907B
MDADLATAVRHAAWIRQVFYVLVLLVALVGQVTGAVQALGVPLVVAVPAVAALELGGMVVMANADVRRRLGERAIGSRLLSAAIAAGAVTFNWAAHPDPLAGGFYAGMSALGYLVWLMHAGNQRRDRLRVTGDLPPTPPAYEVFGHWICHPVVTSRARSVAKADGLDLYESLAAAHTAIARRRRDAAIAKVLHRKIRAAMDPTTADIAVRVYDLDEIAARLAATADYNGLTMVLAADLTPERIMTAHFARRRRRRFKRERLADTPLAPAHAPSPTQAATRSAMDTPGDERWGRNQSQRKTLSRPRAATSRLPTAAMLARPMPCRRTTRTSRNRQTRVRTSRANTSTMRRTTVLGMLPATTRPTRKTPNCPREPRRQWPIGCARSRTWTLRCLPRGSASRCDRSTDTCRRTTPADRGSPGDGNPTPAQLRPVSMGRCTATYKDLHDDEAGAAGARLRS